MNPTPTPTLDRAVSERVRAQMHRHGVGVRALADATGIPRTTLHRRLAHGGFRIAELDTIAAALNVEPATLVPEPGAA